jgi:hypothetical protein
MEVIQAGDNPDLANKSSLVSVEKMKRAQST